jgi:hypothetical protein
MQGRKEGGIDAISIMPTEALLKIVDPFLGGANSRLDFCKVPHAMGLYQPVEPAFRRRI